MLCHKTCLDKKNGLVSRHVLHLLSKLQNWSCPKTGQYKTCIVSNTKIEASIRAIKPKPWQSHLTSETVEIFIQNEKASLVPMQSRFWCGRLSVGTKPVLVQAQSRFWCGRLQNRFCINTGFASSIKAPKLDLSQNGQYRTCIVSNTKIEACLGKKPAQSRFGAAGLA